MLQKSDYLILASAILSLLLSVYLWFNGSREAALFVGLWVPSLLSFGIYFKSQLQGRNYDRS
jgi:hypothetical protein